MQRRAPTVFISYKRDALHDGWVEGFATDLRAAGIDAILDIWEVRLGESFTDYMALKIKDADAVDIAQPEPSNLISEILPLSTFAHKVSRSPHSGFRPSASCVTAAGVRKFRGVLLWSRMTSW